MVKAFTERHFKGQVNRLILLQEQIVDCRLLTERRVSEEGRGRAKGDRGEPS